MCAVYGWGSQDACVSLAMRTAGRQHTPKWVKNEADVAVSDRSARWSLTTIPQRCARFLEWLLPLLVQVLVAGPPLTSSLFTSRI